MPLVIFPSSSSLEHPEQGGSCQETFHVVFSAENRGQGLTSLFQLLKKRLWFKADQGWYQFLLPPTPPWHCRTCSIALLLQEAEFPLNRSRECVRSQLKHCSWRGSSQFHGIVVPLHTPVVTIKISSGFNQVLQENSSLNGGQRFLFLFF